MPEYRWYKIIQSWNRFRIYSEWKSIFDSLSLADCVAYINVITDESYTTVRKDTIIETEIVEKPVREFSEEDIAQRDKIKSLLKKWNRWRPKK